MAKTAQQDWGFTEITRKFERDEKPVRRKASSRRRASVSARGTMHVGLWLTAVSICLLGLVAVHVGLLKKNMEFNDLVREKNSLSADNARLSSEVAGLNSPERIEQIATRSLGMVPPEKVQYVYIGPAGARQNYADLGTTGAGRTAAP